MKIILVTTLLLLSLGLTACVVEPGGGYRDRGYDHGYGYGGGHAEFDEHGR